MASAAQRGRRSAEGFAARHLTGSALTTTRIAVSAKTPAATSAVTAPHMFVCGTNTLLDVQVPVPKRGQRQIHLLFGETSISVSVIVRL